MKRIRYIIPSLLAAGLGPGDPAQALYVRAATEPKDDPNRGSLLDVFRQDHTVILADHRSHSSHSSHTSHRSSSGGGYYGGSSSSSESLYTPPVYTPPPIRSQPVIPAEPTPLFSQNERATPVQATPTTLSGRTKRFASIVRRVQIALMARELYNGPIDGVVGPKLRAALRKFQNGRSLPATGTITPQTLDALMVSSD